MWSRGLTRGSNWLAPSRCYSTAGIDDFLSSVTSAPIPAATRSRTVLESATDYCKWLDKNPVTTCQQFIVAAQMAVTVKAIEKKKAFSKIEDVAKKVLPTLYPTFQVKDTVETLRFALQLNSKNQVSHDIQKLFIEKQVKAANLSDVDFDTLVKIIRYSDSSVEQYVLDTIAEAFINRIDQELQPTQLLAILAGEGYSSSRWFNNEKFIKKASMLVTVMDNAERCALLNYMAAGRQRNMSLLGAVINSISSSNQCLTVSQIVNFVNSCSVLTYYPAKVAAKISDSLEKNSNVINKWSDVVSISNSLVRMKSGDQKAWDLLVRWAIENEKNAHVQDLSRFVTALARIGVPSGRPLAKLLRTRLDSTKFNDSTYSQDAWLNNIYSLAYFQELDATRADSVLNKSFVEQIMNSKQEVHDRLRRAMTLLMINSAAKYDLNGKYDGPTVNKETFARFGIHFDAKTLLNARQLKYSKNQSECDELFLKYLFRVAPQDTHCRISDVEECGAFVDAYVLPDESTGLLVSTSQWGTKKPRPVFFYGWMQTKRNCDAKGEFQMLGQEQLGLRLMRAEGYEPVVVTKSELDYCPTNIDKVNFLRDKIHKNK